MFHIVSSLPTVLDKVEKWLCDFLNLSHSLHYFLTGYISPCRDKYVLLFYEKGKAETY